MYPFVSSFSIERLIHNFNQSDESSKVRAANQFAYDLIDLHDGKSQIPNTPPQFNELQKSNFLSLISCMIEQELSLSFQITELKTLLSAAPITSIDYSTDTQYNYFIFRVYNDYFFEKKQKILNYSNGIIDRNALFNYTTNAFFNPWTFHEFVVNNQNAFTYLRFCQVKRLTRIIGALSQYFTQISGCSYDVLEKYSPIINGYNSWLALISLLPKNTLPFFNLGIFCHLALIHQGTNFGSAELFFQCLLLGAKIRDLDGTSQRKALQLAICSDHKALFIKLIESGVLPTKEELNNVQKNINDFLKYQPGKQKLRIGEYITQPGVNFVDLQSVIHDEANTSDEESSDEENDSFQLTNVSLIGQDNFQLLARGVNYSPSYFTPQKRRESKQPPFHQQTVYSRSTTELKEKIESTGTDSSESFEQADKLVKSYFKLLKLTPDKPELQECTKKYKKKRYVEKQYEEKERTKAGEKAEFESLYYHFVQAYVNSYGDLFNQGGITRNFNAPNNSNPVISVTPDIKVACRYASGKRINHSVKFIPKIRRSTGEIKHNRLGYVEIYLIDDAYRREHATDVDQLKQDGKIGLVHNYSFNGEILVESSIPAKYVLGYQCFSLPRMNALWSPQIENRYGLNSQNYNKFKDRLFQARSNPKDCELIVSELIETVTKWQATQLKQQIDNLRFSKVIPANPINKELSDIEKGLSQLNINNTVTQPNFGFSSSSQNIQSYVVSAPVFTQVSATLSQGFFQPAVSTVIPAASNILPNSSQTHVDFTNVFVKHAS